MNVFTDEIHLEEEKSKTDAEFYKAKLRAEANTLLHTREYLELKKYEALLSNSKIYYGPDIPKVFAWAPETTNSPVTNLEAKKEPPPKVRQ